MHAGNGRTSHYTKLFRKVFDFESNARGGLRTTYYSEIPTLHVSTGLHHPLDLQVRGKRSYACAIVEPCGFERSAQKPEVVQGRR